MGTVRTLHTVGTVRTVGTLRTVGNVGTVRTVSFLRTEHCGHRGKHTEHHKSTLHCSTTVGIGEQPKHR